MCSVTLVTLARAARSKQMGSQRAELRGRKESAKSMARTLSCMLHPCEQMVKTRGDLAVVAAENPLFHLNFQDFYVVLNPDSFINSASNHTTSVEGNRRLLSRSISSSMSSPLPSLAFVGMRAQEFFGLMLGLFAFLGSFKFIKAEVVRPILI